MYIGNSNVILIEDDAKAANEIASKIVSFNEYCDSVSGSVTFTGSSLNLNLSLNNTVLTIAATGNRDRISELIHEICDVVKEMNFRTLTRDNFTVRLSHLTGRTSKGGFSIFLDRQIQAKEAMI